MTHRNIPCTMDSSGQVLMPSQINPVAYAELNLQQSEIGGTTGTLSFAGQVQAFLTYDDAGQVVGYTFAGNDSGAQTSVENIIATL